MDKMETIRHRATYVIVVMVTVMVVVIDDDEYDAGW